MFVFGLRGRNGKLTGFFMWLRSRKESLLCFDCFYVRCDQQVSKRQEMRKAKGWKKNLISIDFVERSKVLRFCNIKIVKRTSLLGVEKPGIFRTLESNGRKHKISGDWQEKTNKIIIIECQTQRLNK